MNWKTLDFTKISLYKSRGYFLCKSVVLSAVTVTSMQARIQAVTMNHLLTRDWLYVYQLVEGTLAVEEPWGDFGSPHQSEHAP